VPFGSSPFGLSSFGAGFVALSVAGAYALSTHTVRVQLTAEPTHADALDDGDALNPATWTVINEATGAVFTVLDVTEHAVDAYDLSLLEALGDQFTEHTVGSEVLLDANGALIVAPYLAEFLGTSEEIDPFGATALEPFRDRDLRNPPFNAGGLSGTLVYSDDNDFENEDGADLTKKLVLRRWSTPPGGFKHLGLSYGVGITEKEPIPGGNLIQLRTQLETQALREPDVESCQVSLSLTRDNSLIIDAVIVLQRSGISVPFRASPSGSQLVEIR
jgi:hypothetical protein